MGRPRDFVAWYTACCAVRKSDDTGGVVGNVQADRQRNCPVGIEGEAASLAIEQYLDFAREVEDDLLVIGRDRP
jgi:hypothetical protein